MAVVSTTIESCCMGPPFQTKTKPTGYRTDTCGLHNEEGLHYVRNLATDGLQILAVTLTNGNSHMKRGRAELPVASQTAEFPRPPSHSS